MADAKLDADALDRAIEIGQATATPVTLEKIHYAIVPENCKLESLREYQYPGGLRPERIIADVKLVGSKSFCEYVQLYRDIRTRIFAQPEIFEFLAVMDYHGAAEERAAEFLSHRVRFRMRLSEQWKVWFQYNDYQFTQEKFADFLEDNVRDIKRPDAATMLEVARDMKAKLDGNFESKVVRKDGTVQLRYTETVQATVGAGNLEVPEEFAIEIPVFYGEAPVQVTARLRYRISGGKLTFHYKLYRPVETVNDAFNVAVTSIETELVQTVLLGSI